MNNYLNPTTFRLNPFRPDEPVPPEFFFGRKIEIDQIASALLNTHLKRAQHILIQGERGIGKTSIARYAENIGILANSFFPEEKPSFFVIFVGLGACRNLDEVCIAIANEFRKRCGNSVREKIVKLISSIKGLQIGPIGITFSESTEYSFLVPIFTNMFEGLLEQIRNDYSGVLVILDETEQLSWLKGSVGFFKNLFEKLKGDNFNNVMFLLTATPEGVERLTGDHESFPRLFRFVILPRMDRNESRELIENTLDKGEPKLTIVDDILENMYYFSEGYPNFLQEFGYACFEVDTDKVITKNDFTYGILGEKNKFKGALDTIYDRYLSKILTRDLLSERYREILTVFGDTDEEILTLKDIQKVLPKIKGMSGYLGVLVKRGILTKPPGTSGKYKVSSRMLELWLRLRRLEKRPITK